MLADVRGYAQETDEEYDHILRWIKTEDRMVPMSSYVMELVNRQGNERGFGSA